MAASRAELHQSVCVHANECTCTYARTHSRMHARTHTRTHARTHGCTHACMHACTQVPPARRQHCSHQPHHVLHLHRCALVGTCVRDHKQGGSVSMRCEPAASGGIYDSTQREKTDSKGLKRTTAVARMCAHCTYTRPHTRPPARTHARAHEASLSVSVAVSEQSMWACSIHQQGPRAVA